MSDPRTPDLERVILTGLLETGAPLHIGSGFDDPAPADDPDTDRSAIIAVCRDATARPYLPASTLRGLLRRHAPPDGACAARLFGYARQAVPKGSPTATADIGRAGALRVYDARVAGDAPVTLATDTRIAIDPITRTARDRHLFTEQWVPQQTRFHCRFELDRIDQADLDAFLTMLQAAFDGGPDNGLGAGRSRMHGRLHWTKDGLRLRTLSRDDYLLWLWANAPLDRFYQERNVAIVTPEPLPSQFGATSTATPDRAGLTLRFGLCPQSPLLCSGTIPKKGWKTGKHGPDRMFLTADGKVLVPASSLKGALRSHCRRILLTMFDARRPDGALTDGRIADRLLARIFGTTETMASLYVGDASGPWQASDEHPQFFNAIDRFTGGTADQRLYQVKAVIPRRLDWTVFLKPSLLQTEWALGLLVYTLRDAMEGDLRIGWGAARGYGAFRLVWLRERDDDLDDWALLLERLDNGGLSVTKDQVHRWLTALDTELDRQLATVEVKEPNP